MKRNFMLNAHPTVSPKLTIILTFLTCFLLTACGGGSGSPSDTGQVNTTPPVENIPQYSLIKPQYTGESSKLGIAPSDASKTILEITSAIDLVTSIIYGDSRPQFSIFPTDGDDTASSEILCSSGSAETIVVVKDRHLTVRYNDCVQDDIKVSGTVELYIVKLIAESELQDMDLVSNLTITDMTSDEALSMSGYISIRKNLNDAGFSSTIQLVLKNDTEQLYLDDLVLKEEIDFNQLSYNGDIYLSDYGLISIETLSMSNESQVTQFSSLNSIAANISLRQTISFTFNQQTIPVVIDLRSIPDSVWDDINDVPIAKMTTNALSGERNTEFEISSLESSDPDLEPLNYSWSILNKPIDSNGIISNDKVSRLVTDLPGNYVIQLTLTDSAGNSDSTTEEFYIAQGSPNIEITESASTISVDEGFSASVNYSNDQYDGPIQYRLAYGPAGMNIDPSGQIIWTAFVPDFSQTLEVNFAINAFNKDKITTIERKIRVESLHKNEVHSLLTPYAFSANADWGRNNDIYMDLSGAERLITDNGEFGIVEYSLDENGRIAASSLFTAIPDGFKYRGSVFNDFEKTHFFVTEDEDDYSDQRVELWALTDSSGALARVDSAASDLWETVVFKDMNNDGKIELIGYGINFQVNPKVYSLENYALIYDTTNTFGEFISFCDVNNDGIDELITESQIHSIKDNSPISEAGLIIVEQINTTDSEDCSMLAENDDRSLRLVNWLDGNLISTPLSGEVLYAQPWFKVNLQPNINSALMYYDSISQNWIVVNINSTGTVTRSPLAGPDGFDLTNILNVLDLDGDGIDELLVGKYIDSAIDSTDVEGVLSALNVLNGSVVEKYKDSKSFIDLATNNNIAEFTGDSVVAYRNFLFSSSRQGVFSKNGDSQTSIITSDINEEVIGSSSTNGQLFFYTVGGSNDAPYIAKYSESGGIIWSTNVQGRFDNYVLENFQVQDGVIFIAASNDQLILNDTNGDIYQQTNSAFGALRSLVSPPNFDQLLILDALNQTVVTVENNQLKVLYDAKDDNWGLANAVSVIKFDFIQFDDDPQLELILHTTTDKKYFILDTISWNMQQLPVFDEGILIEDSVFFNSSDSVCFNHDSVCKNTLLRADTISMVDKLTGKLVWRAPISIGQSSTIKFYTAPNLHISTAIGGSGLTIFD